MADRLTSQDVYYEKPLPPWPMLLTKNNDFKRQADGDPWPAIEIYAARVAGRPVPGGPRIPYAFDDAGKPLYGFQTKHPLDRYIEDLAEFGALAHHLDNGAAVWGRLMDLKTEAG